MHPKTLKHLDDIRDAAVFIEEVTSGKSLDDYRNDRVLRQVVERNFEIIGEAMNRLRRDDPQIAANVSDAGDIVAFRNALIHGYDVIDGVRDWRTVIDDVPRLGEQMASLLRDAGSSESEAP